MKTPPERRRLQKTNGFQNEKPNDNVNENVNDNVNVVVNEAAFSERTGEACGGENSPSGITFDDNDKKIHTVSQKLFSYRQKRFPFPKINRCREQRVLQRSKTGFRGLLLLLLDARCLNLAKAMKFAQELISLKLKNGKKS